MNASILFLFIPFLSAASLGVTPPMIETGLSVFPITIVNPSDQSVEVALESDAGEIFPLLFIIKPHQSSVAVLHVLRSGSVRVISDGLVFLIPVKFQNSYYKEKVWTNLFVILISIGVGCGIVWRMIS